MYQYMKALLTRIIPNIIPGFSQRFSHNNKNKDQTDAEKMAYAKDIKVDTDSNGVVWLSGTVATKEEADKANTIAHDTDGVKPVHNDINVTSGR
jgi:hypothetical protein